jgi:hypothetical protein
MDLLKQISEDIKSYRAFVETLVEKIESIEEDLSLEKRLGLLEAAYYQNDNPKAAGKPNDTIEFEPQQNVAKPQQIPGPPKGMGGNKMTGRIQLMYNPATGKVEDAKQAQGPNTGPAPGYVAANAQQLQDALKHIEGMDKSLADKIVAGNVQVFVPQNPQSQAPKLTRNVQQHGGMNRIEMSDQDFKNAQAAADQMTYQK